MMRRRMSLWSRIGALALCLVIAAIALGGCEKKPEGPLHICVDAPKRCGGNNTSFEFENFLKWLAEEGGPNQVEVEYLPEDGEDRDNMLTRLRNEIMGGGGPDLFIVCQPGGFKGQSIFPFPEQSMRNGLMMNLDKYIENAQFTDWSALEPTVMAAGRTEKGQFLVPLSFTFPVTCFRQSDYTHTPSKDMTWDDVMGSDDRFLRACQPFLYGGENCISNVGNLRIDGILGRLADYEAEELCFTPEDLSRVIKGVLEMEQQEQEFEELPVFFQDYVSSRFYCSGESMQAVSKIYEDEPLTIVPQYSLGGGVSAVVESYACVNANSAHGEEAFYILDKLLNTESQQSSALYTGLFTYWEGAPMDTRLMSGEYPLKPGRTPADGPMPDETFEAYTQARQAITHVSFHGKLQVELYDLFHDCLNVYYGYEEGDIDQLVAEACRVLNMELKES